MGKNLYIVVPRVLPCIENLPITELQIRYTRGHTKSSEKIAIRELKTRKKRIVNLLHYLSKLNHYRFNNTASIIPRINRNRLNQICRVTRRCARNYKGRNATKNSEAPIDRVRISAFLGMQCIRSKCGDICAKRSSEILRNFILTGRKRGISFGWVCRVHPLSRTIRAR